MAAYKITFASSARSELEGLPARIVTRIFRKIEMLSQQPRPSGVKKLQGAKNAWRIRIGDYRVIYTVDDRNSVVDVVTVRHRSKAYE